MILQTDLRLNETINKTGCYLMCIFYLVNKYTNLMLSDVIINNYFLLLQTIKGRYSTYVLASNGYVNDVDKIFNYLGLDVTYTGVHESPKYLCKSGEIEILCLQNKSNHNLFHFVVGDGNGNETYNPMGTSKDYILYSKRIFIINK